MRTLLFVVLALGTALASAAASAAPAPEWVEFTTATTPPTPFAVKQAKARGIELKQEPGTPLRGLLVRPDGAGPSPAVVLLHGCDGVQPFQEQWAAELASWGYVALLVDSHGPRGCGCDDQRGPAASLSGRVPVRLPQLGVTTLGGSRLGGAQTRNALASAALVCGLSFVILDVVEAGVG